MKYFLIYSDDQVVAVQQTREKAEAAKDAFVAMQTEHQYRVEESDTCPDGFGFNTKIEFQKNIDISLTQRFVYSVSPAPSEEERRQIDKEYIEPLFFGIPTGNAYTSEADIVIGDRKFHLNIWSDYKLFTMEDQDEDEGGEGHD